MDSSSTLSPFSSLSLLVALLGIDHTVTSYEHCFGGECVYDASTSLRLAWACRVINLSCQEEVQAHTKTKKN